MYSIQFQSQCTKKQCQGHFQQFPESMHVPEAKDMFQDQASRPESSTVTVSTGVKYLETELLFT